VSLEEPALPFSKVIDAVPDAMVVVDRNGHITMVNAQTERMFGYTRAELSGRSVELLVPERHRAAHLAHREQYHRQPAVRPMGLGLDLFALRKDGELFPVEISLSPLELAGQTVVVAAIRDITDRKKAEAERMNLIREQAARAEAELSAHRMAFLADASRVLSESLDYETTLAAIARLAVPALADWCAVDIVDETGRIRRLAMAHTDPAREKLAREWMERHPIRPTGQHGVPSVLRTGRSELCEEIPKRWLDRATPAGADRALLDELQLRSMVVVPLAIRGRITGAISLLTAESGRRYDRADLALAEELARRAGLAVENALLYRESRESDQQKEKFLAMLAHELRNPLAPIVNALHVLDRISPPAAEAAYLRGIIGRQTRHLARLVDDLLDVSRVRLGKIQLNQGPVDVRDVARRALETAHVAGKTRSHNVALDVGTEPLVVRGDAVRLEQVVGNLLDNAVKYTPAPGSIKIHVEREADEAVIRVEDRGVGIAGDVLAKIFDVFAQADASLDRSRGGLGLGLALVRALVELHGGTVSARSAGPGLGSEFSVRLPLVPEQAAAVDRWSPGRLTRRRILIVEDNADTRETLRALLELDGHAIETASDGPQGLDLARRTRPDVALVDIGLPGIDGYEIARRLRADGEKVYLIALTGYGQPEDRTRSMEAGFDAHLVKPVDPGDVTRALSRAPTREG
jgi:PAS domain S-box-containing protein